MREFKQIRRTYIDYENGEAVVKENGLFKAEGEWADGHLAYSRLNEDGTNIEGEEGMYIQERISGKLIMERV